MWSEKILGLNHQDGAANPNGHGHLANPIFSGTGTELGYRFGTLKSLKWIPWMLGTILSNGGNTLTVKIEESSLFWCWDIKDIMEYYGKKNTMKASKIMLRICFMMLDPLRSHVIVDEYSCHRWPSNVGFMYAVGLQYPSVTTAAKQWEGKEKHHSFGETMIKATPWS